MERELSSIVLVERKLESKRAVSAVSKATTHRYSASIMALRPFRGGLRTAGRESWEAMVQARCLADKFKIIICVVGRVWVCDVC